MLLLPRSSLSLRYVPNNGWDATHFERRKSWDDAVLRFIKRQREKGVHMLWIGDLVRFAFCLLSCLLENESECNATNPCTGLVP